MFGPMRAMFSTLFMLLATAACVTAPVVAPPASPSPAASGPVLVVGALEGLGLFGSEIAEAEDSIAAWARAHGHRVVDPAHAREIYARARAGRDAKTGEACGLPLSRWRATSRWKEALGAEGQLDAHVACDEETAGCRLEVTAREGIGFDDDVLADHAAPFDARAPWRDALRRALGALVPRRDDAGAGGLGLVGGLGSDEVRARPERLDFSAWPARAMDREKDMKQALTFSGAEGTMPLRACFFEGGSAELLVDVDDRGNVARCESRTVDDVVPTCACAAFIAHANGGPPIRGKRANVGVHFQPADMVARWGALVTASVRTYLESYKDRRGETLWRPAVSQRTISEWEPPGSEVVTKCFADVPVAASFRASVRVTFDAAGRATDVALRAAGATPLSDSQSACLRGAFLQSRAPCPGAPSATALAEVAVAVRAITR